MKIRIKIYYMFIFVIGFSCSAGFSYFYNQNTGYRSDVVKETSEISITELSKFKANQLVGRFDSISLHDIERDIMLLLRSDIERSPHLLFYFNKLIEKLVLENSQNAIAITESKAFAFTKEETQRRYVKKMFSVLAGSNPTLFFDYFSLLKKDWHIRGYAFEGFFRSLIDKDAKLAYQMLSDNRIASFFMRGSKEHVVVSMVKYGMHTEIGTFGYTAPEGHLIGMMGPNAYWLKVNYLRRLAIEGMDASDTAFFEEELKKANGKMERISVLESIARTATVKNYESLVDWAKSSLSANDQGILFSSFLKNESDTRKDWHQLWNIAQTIGLSKLSAEALDPIFLLAASEDPLQSIDLINESYNGSKKESALASILVSLNETVPSEKMILLYDSLPDSQSKQVSYEAIIRKYANEHPAEAIEWMEENYKWDFIPDAVVAAVERKNSNAMQKVIDLLDYEDATILWYIGRGLAFADNKDDVLDALSQIDMNKRSEIGKEFYMSWSFFEPDKSIVSLMHNESLKADRENITIAVVDRYIDKVGNVANQEKIISILTHVENVSFLETLIAHYVKNAPSQDVEGILNKSQIVYPSLHTRIKQHFDSLEN